MAAPEQPYGELAATVLRAVTWNVWGRFGPWQQRHLVIEHVLMAAAPDVVCLQESWACADGSEQASTLAERLGLAHHCGTTPELLYGDWGPVNVIMSRWPLVDVEEHVLPCIDDGWGGLVLRAVVDGPRGPVDVYCVALDWPPQASLRRQHAVGLLAQLIHDRRPAASRPLLVAGDFNAAPESDEVRMLTGLRPPPVDNFVLFDAWASADGDGATWSRSNTWAAPILLPERRIDYLFVGWPGRSGVGSVISAQLIGTEAVEGIVASDHYGVLARLRY